MIQSRTRFATPTHPHARFLLLGEPLALDLVNTRIRREGLEIDTLDTAAALTAWLRAERPRLVWRGRVGSAELAAVRQLRDAIDTLLRARRSKTPPPHAALACINRALAAHADPAQLLWNAHGPVLAPRTAHTRSAALLYTVASDALACLTGPDAAHIRECAHPDCRLQFLASNPRRRWCSSTTCGNRARVALHYQRQHQSA